MFERPRRGERTILVYSPAASDAANGEFQALASSAGVECVAVVTTGRRTPDPRLFLGRGKAEELRAAIVQHQAALALFDYALSSSQQRNLEDVLQCHVLDRTGLILDIFSQRARSFEGKLQVELATLRYLATRLVRGWTHLERQRGGIGLRGGPGETQLESDRRLLAERIRYLEQRLHKVERQRHQSRRNRIKTGIPTVALVGYTNAGKSTLFNRLTQAGVYAADQLFATLDPTLRRVTLDDGKAFVLADTVGFIERLPHELIAAFRATLQETRDADLLLHVIDASHPEILHCIAQVEEVLQAIGAGAIPCLQVFNKIDRVEVLSDRAQRAVQVSAISGAGLDRLKQSVAEMLGYCTQPASFAPLPQTAAVCYRESVDDLSGH